MTASDYKTLDIQYLECCRKYRVDFNEDSFNASKLDIMQKRLALRTLSIEDVENLMNWPLQPRDAAGFFNTGALRFPPGDTLYSGITGVSVNVLTGSFDYLLEPAGPDNALFTEREVQFITQNNILDCSFSLDPENLSLVPQPFQQMSFLPENLEDTDFLKTLLISDYLLKCLINGINVSSKAPFRKQPIAFLLEKMSPELQKALVSPKLRREKSSKESIVPVATRCWIECEAVASAYEQDEKTHIVFFGKTKCTVKNQLFRSVSKEEKSADKAEDYILRHNLVEFTGDGSSGEEKFAEAMTAVYDELAEFLPVFKRLKELTKLCAANKILSSIVKCLAESLEIPYDVKSTSSVGKWAIELKSSCVLVPSTFVVDYCSSPSSGEKTDLKVTDRIDAQDIFCSWFTAEVVRETETRVLIHYDGWGEEWNEWFSKNSPRLQPIHTYTPSGQRSTGRGSGVLRLPATGTAMMALCSDKRFREAKVIDAKDQSVQVEFPDKTKCWCTEFQFRLFDDFEPASAESFSQQKFNIGQDVDTVDVVYRCYTGTIVQQSASGSLKVHFDGWSSEFDEWVPAGMIKSRLFPLHTYTQPKMRTVGCGPGIPNGSVAVIPPIGDKIIFVKDKQAFSGAVEKASPCGKKFLVRYQGGTEWVSVDEGRVQRAEVVMNAALGENVANGKFNVGDDIDARDSCFGWFTATVTAVDEVGGRISVHWHGWPSSHDEWIRIGTSRLAPLHTHTKNKSPPNSFGVPVAPDIGGRVILKVDGTQIFGEVLAKLSTTAVSVKCDDGVQRNADVSKYGSVIDDITVELAFSDLPNFAYGGIKLNVTSSLMKSENEPLRTKSKETKEQKPFNIYAKAGALGLCVVRKNIFTCIGEVGSTILVGNAAKARTLVNEVMAVASTVAALALKATPISLLVGAAIELGSQVVFKDVNEVCLADFNDEYNENRALKSKLKELVACTTYTVLKNLHIIDNSSKLTKEELEAALAQEKALKEKN